jgi:hypothetical protein
MYSAVAINKITKKLFKKEWLGEEGIWIGKGKEHSKKRFICGEWVMFIYNHFLGWFEDNWYKGAPVDLFNSGNFEKYYFNKKAESLQQLKIGIYNDGKAY